MSERTKARAAWCWAVVVGQWGWVAGTWITWGKVTDEDFWKTSGVTSGRMRGG